MNYKFSDEVWCRVVQIIQEAMIVGIDVVDMLRMIEVTAVEGTLTLTEEYKENVEKMRQRWLEAIEEKRTNVGNKIDSN